MIKWHPRHLNFSEMRKLYWIMYSTHIHTEREKICKISWKEFWKFQVNKTNFGSVYVVKYIYICINFWIYEILLRQLKFVSTFFIFTIKIKLWKIIRNASYFNKKAPFVLDVFKFLYFTLPLFFPFLSIAGFTEEVDWW